MGAVISFESNPMAAERTVRSMRCVAGGVQCEGERKSKRKGIEKKCMHVGNNIEWCNVVWRGRAVGVTRCAVRAFGKRCVL